MISCPWNNKLVKCVSLPTWNCVELAKLDMSSQLMLPKLLWHPWFCHALITASPCCQGFLNIDKLQKVQNCSARLIFKTSKCTRFTTFGSTALASNSSENRLQNFLLVLWCCLRYCSAILVWSPLPLRPFPFTAFLCWHPNLSDSNTKEKVPRAACFLPSRPCHL